MNIINVLKNAIYLLFGNIFVKFISAFTIIYVANFLSAEKYGVLSLSLALSSIFIVLSELGLNNTLIREATKFEKSYESLIISYFKVRLFLFFIVLLLIIFILEVFYHDSIYKNSIYVVVILNTLGNMFISFSTVHFQITEKMKYITLITSLSGLTTSIALWISMYFKGDILSFSLSYGLSTLIIGILGFLYVIKFNYKGNFLSDLKKIEFQKSLLKELHSFTQARVISTFSRQMGPVVLERVSSVSQVGLFSVAYKIPSILYTIPQAFATAFYTILFKYGNQSMESAIETHNKLTIIQLKIMSFMGLALWFPFLFYSEYIISLIFNDDWSASAKVLMVISIVVFFQSINYPLGDALTTSGYQKERTKVLRFSLIIGFLSLCGLGFLFGALGAAYAIVLMEISLFLGLVIYKKQGLKIFIKSTYLNLVTFLIIVLIKKIIFNLYSLNEIFEIIVLEGVYCAIVLFLNSRLIYNIIKNR